MTDIPTPTVPELSISSPSESSPGHSPTADDHDFFERLLYLNSEGEMMRYSAAEEPCLTDAADSTQAVVNLDPEADPDDSHYHQKKPPNGFVSNSEPTILPPNALRLHLADPSAPLTTPHDPVHPPSDPLNHQVRPSRVRFRSRVRITSGFSHHRRKSDVGSSRSGSASSSISAPLRSYSDGSTNTWGTLGQRVGLLALQRKIMGSPEAQQRQKGQVAPSGYVDERTPLRNSFNHSSYVEGVQDGNIFDEDSDDERLSRDVDEVFGKFPGRLLNHHWWYWQLEPIICCHYLCCHYAADLE
ncbi:hypothetical protein PILCRDRAFT_818354 [Piloderma croceum F 1598]|uniref:Uncharacterized protein n=1 Tax=Piloderma croceum (strain F 1598) TaxID=765440 RepID=A0A0C3G2A9_PILCF|nr:hypothetical protein PILCRDRAFT_818354 [Piloderma croceum F 1598]